MIFPTDDKARKMLPVFSMITRYFPKAMREITRVCVANNVRYNPERDPTDINWARGKSPDHLGSAFRHMLERTVDGRIFESVDPLVQKATGINSVYVLAEAAWRICAALELEIEHCEQPNNVIQSGTLAMGGSHVQINSQDAQCNSGQRLRSAGTPISDRGQESC